MDEFVEEEWQDFHIDRARYELFLAHVEQTAKNLTPDPDDQDDIRGKMWQKCLETRLDPPKDYPTNPDEQDNYCKGAMSNAACACLWRDLPDGPIVRPGYVDPDRRTLTFTEIE